MSAWPPGGSRLKRVLLWFFAGLGALVFLLLAVYAVEDWRGRRAWAEFKREWEAKGVRFDVASVVPPAVPDAENFAATPILAELFGPNAEKAKERASNLEKAVAPKHATLRYGSWTSGVFSSFEASPEGKPKEPLVRTPEAARALLASLGKVAPEMREIEEAAKRPASRFPVDYERGLSCLLPHLGTLRSFARLFEIRACAELATGDSARAMDDAAACLRISESVAGEPLLISHLVRVATLSLALQPVWEGLQERRWNDAQLAEFQGRLRMNLLAELARSLDGGERVLATLEIERLARAPAGLESLLVAGDPRGGAARRRALLFAVPPGWVCQNLVRINRYHLEWMKSGMDSRAGRVHPAALKGWEEGLARQSVNPYNALMKILMPALSKAVQTSAMSQTLVDEARVACGLERYRLKYGRFPETLDELVPAFLGQVPGDVVAGAPLKYRLDAPDRFALWSVGWNGVDEGGSVAWTNGQPPRVDRDHGDWAWPQPR
jgi:hypothetical protein